VIIFGVVAFVTYGFWHSSRHDRDIAYALHELLLRPYNGNESSLPEVLRSLPNLNLNYSDFGIGLSAFSHQQLLNLDHQTEWRLEHVDGDAPGWRLRRFDWLSYDGKNIFERYGKPRTISLPE
jgi:hypothetical protein